MKVQQTLLYLLGLVTTIQALALPAAFNPLFESSSELHKRKGGGGGRGGGGTSGGGSRSGSGSSGGGSRVSSGAGTPRSFGGGSRYGGGAAQPYRAGSAAGWRGPAPVLLGVGALALFPGLWLYGAYSYRYSDNDEDQTYFNETSQRNESRPVECLCGEYAQCGCEIGDQQYLNEAANDEEISVVRNGTLYINGTLDNDTVAPGQEVEGAAGGLQQRLVESLGYWPVVAGVAYTVLF